MNSNLNIYQYFNCENKEQLYELLKNDDPSVKELKDFISFLEKIRNKNFVKINNPNDFFKYSIDNFLPNYDEICIYGLDVKNQILSKTILNVKKDREINFNKIIKDLYDKSLYQTIIIYNGVKNNLEVENLSLRVINGLEKIDFSPLDTFVVRDNFIESRKSREPIYFNKNFSEAYKKIENKKDENILKDDLQEDIKKFDKLRNLKKVDEFINHYTDNEIKGLNYYKDSEKILNLLRLSYQNLYYEKFGFLVLDDNYNVKKIKEFSSGDVHYSSVPYKRIIKELVFEDTKNFVAFHNHPSGNLQSSHEDNISSEKVLKALEFLDKNLIDSVIISDKGFEFLSSTNGIINNKFLDNLEVNLKDFKVDEKVKIKSLDELKDFKYFREITKLTVKNNSLENVESLKDFTNLKEVNFTNNPIKYLKNFEVISEIEKTKNVKFILDFEQKNRLNFVKKEKEKSINSKLKTKDKVKEKILKL